MEPKLVSQSKFSLHIYVPLPRRFNLGTIVPQFLLGTALGELLVILVKFWQNGRSPTQD